MNKKILWVNRKRIAEYFGIKPLQHPLVKIIQEKSKQRLQWEDKDFVNNIQFMEMERDFIKEIRRKIGSL